MGELNERQLAFVDNLPLCDFNGTRAVIKSGYAENGARVTAHRLLTNTNVQKALHKAAKGRRDRAKVDADYILSRHQEIDQLDILDIITDDMRGIRPLSDWPKAWRTSVNGIDVTEMIEYVEGSKDVAGFIKKIKLPDKLRNLEKMGCHIDVQAYKEKVIGSFDVSHIMPVPSCTSVDEWEEAANKQAKP